MPKRARMWSSRGSFKNTKKFFSKMQNRDYLKRLNDLAQLGVDALAEATPKKSGLTADSWSYHIDFHSYGLTVIYENSNVVNGYFNVALEIQYGHGTKGGNYVEGIDYINPALKPVFQRIADDIWREVQES